MLRDEAEFGGSIKRGEVGRAVLLDSSTRITRLTNAISAVDPPPYGAQRHQDPLWKGGNEALPLQWHQFKMLHSGSAYYEQSNPYMISLNRPLPGVQLDGIDGPVDLVPGCEWRISPHGRSYFINHNTQTTS
ncbi:hypothetical protein K503DRAFT_598047 [Rhizopogon vinicolor AM-OR11-026]|uniref:WW domain-containing protein n=1 Tax=Rhizopogon vinicolor AM-OR11-026 TaxID=1314800 RepID=A0A1B7MIY8_9AGAM|nr:hypothetical protein K503DRAFT_598047 [Rhizopogon vinicolor AM-OR11-026]